MASLYADPVLKDLKESAMIIDWMSAELFAIAALFVGNFVAIVTKRVNRS